MIFFYPILIGFMWIALQLSNLWVEFNQQQHFMIQELYYLKAYYLAQSALTIALNYPWEKIKFSWQCKQQDEMEFCIKLLSQSSLLILGKAITDKKTDSFKVSGSLRLYQLAILKVNEGADGVIIQRATNGWLDYCPIANEKICSNESIQ